MMLMTERRPSLFGQWSPGREKGKEDRDTLDQRLSLEWVSLRLSMQLIRSYCNTEVISQDILFTSGLVSDVGQETVVDDRRKTE